MVIQCHLMGFDGIYDDIPSGKHTKNELERSTMLSMGKSTNFRLGHDFNSYANYYQRVSIDISPIDSL